MERLERLLTPTEVAEALGLCVRQIHKLINAGKLPGYRLSRKVLRVRESDLLAYIESKKIPNEPNRPGYYTEPTERTELEEAILETLRELQRSEPEGRWSRSQLLAELARNDRGCPPSALDDAVESLQACGSIGVIPGEGYFAT